ncbi:Cell surface protein [Acidisarcina polymorpha]|uniref:Cell surface protein n=1 Tax=Acidisarcina polymorpha TaxID=2211140 RepID=A0A2Z5G907_9BACT|nr:SBBP repeat-containing protein [Acidisarcina polymorpha]AXC15762.1 Cell surface protein [Acidisarcina polymorpha]
MTLVPFLRSLVFVYIQLSLGLALGHSQLGSKTETTNFPKSSFPAMAKVDEAAIATSYGKLVLSFEANEGQSDPQVKFLSRGSGYSLFLTDTSAVLALAPTPNVARSKQRSELGGAWALTAQKTKTDVLRMDLAGASHGRPMIGTDRLPGNANYFIGNDPAKWRTDVPTFAKVRFPAVYSGIDLVYYGNQRQLEFDFEVTPGADPNQIKLHFSGQDKLKLNSEGDLMIATNNNQVVLHKPVVYQLKTSDRQSEQASQREAVKGGFALLGGNTVEFRLGGYDKRRKLIIDPTLTYSTYLGGSGDDKGNGDYALGIAVDSGGNAYVTGVAWSAGFPVTKGAFQTSSDDQESSAFVTKMNPSGTALVYSTFLSGNFADQGNGIAVDAVGDAYVVGTTSSDHFPVTKDAIQGYNAGAQYGSPNAFISKLDSSGSSLLFSTYLGGSGRNYSGPPGDSGLAIAVDAHGNAYVTGQAYSDDFPVTDGAFQTYNMSMSEGSNAFVAKLNTTAPALIYSTYLGGSSDDTGNGIAVDAKGNAYLTGAAGSSDFPVTKGAFQVVNLEANAFVTKLNAAGSGLSYSTFLGGSSGEVGYSIAVDSSGSAYVTGSTSSMDFPITSKAFQKMNNAPPDGSSTAFVSKVDPGGTALIYSTYLGGTGGEDVGKGIAIDSSGDALVAGNGSEMGFPVTVDAFQKVAIFSQSTTAPFVTKLNANGSGLIYSTYLGGSGGEYGFGDEGSAIAADSLGSVYFTGTAQSLDFPVTSNAYQSYNGSGSVESNAFIAKFSFVPPIATVTSLTSDSNPQQLGIDVTFAARVRSVKGNGTPTGMMVFTVDGITMANEALDGSGRAVYMPGSLPMGKHTITATYSGDVVYSASGTSLTQTISPLAVSTPTFYPLAGTYPVATQFKIESATSGATIYYTTDGSRPTTESMRYTAPLTASTTETVRAIAVKGDVSSVPASGTYNIIPSAIPTETSIYSFRNPFYSGESMTFAAKVTGIEGSSPTGSVIFRHGAVVLGTASLAGGVASFTTSSLVPGIYSITAFYSGNQTFAASISTNLPQTVVGVAAPTFYPLPGTYQLPTQFIIETATPGAAIYYTTDGSTPTADSSTYTGAMTAFSTETIRAIAVSGGSTSATSSSTYSLQPSALTTDTSIKSSLNPSLLGQGIIFTATVKSASGRVPTGSVLFRHGATVIGKSTLSKGTATIAVSTLIPSTYSVTAFYMGNSTNAASISLNLVQVVNK